MEQYLQALVKIGFKILELLTKVGFLLRPVTNQLLEIILQIKNEKPRYLKKFVQAIYVKCSKQY